MFNIRGRETAKINKLINEAAKNRMNDIDFIAKELVKWKNSPERRDMIKAEEYYLGDQPIPKRKVINEKGELENTKNLPENKIIDNQYAKMVNQKVNYQFAKPITLKCKECKDSKHIDYLKKIFNKQFHRILKALAYNSINSGKAWIYIYYENGELSFKRFEPYEFLPFWADNDHTILDFGVRLYEVEGYVGDKEVIIEKVEVYKPDGIHRYILDNDKLIVDVEAGEFEPYMKLTVKNDDKIVKEQNFTWEKIPVICFKGSMKEIPMIKRIKCLQDAINELLSMFKNGMDENAGGNSILVIKNYDGENLGEFRKNLSALRAVKVKTIEGKDGGVDSLEIVVNAENYKSIIELLKKALIENAGGYDVNSLKSGGTPNEMTIKSIYNDIDLDANDLETEYQASFEQLLWFVNKDLQNKLKEDFEEEEVEIILNRDTIVIALNVIDMCKNSVGVISDKTIVANHPWTSASVEEELKQIEREKKKDFEPYNEQFSSHKTKKDNLSGDADEE